MTVALTDEQQRIVDDPSNCAVIARPGSGKTLTLSVKIKATLEDLPYYRGVVAISFTNKASDELRGRCLSGGTDRKGSFFGTIDRFYLTEIIMPFGVHIFGRPIAEFGVITLDMIEDHDTKSKLSKIISYQNWPAEIFNVFKQLYLGGKVVLETIGVLALFVLNKSLACQRYLKARYSHVVIDEYQDCDQWQHEFFVKMVALGIVGIAVGDLDQSIFAFAGKDAKFLSNLAQDSDLFTVYPLSKNHRCHVSIVNYSTKLLSSTYVPSKGCETRMYEKRLEGSEIEIAHWLSTAVPIVSDRFQLESRNQIGVLVKNSRTGNFIHRNLGIPHKAIVSTPLDVDTSIWGTLFRRILHWLYSTDLTKYELIEEYLSIDLQTTIVRSVMKLLKKIEDANDGRTSANLDLIEDFVQIATCIFPRARHSEAIDNLAHVLSNQQLLNSFVPPALDDTLLTLHKSKGLEFRVVFHLDLYKWIIPQFKGDLIQEKNLHYVGITRAKECCVLCTSSHRHNAQGQLVKAEASDFLYTNGLDAFRSLAEF